MYVSISNSSGRIVQVYGLMEVISGVWAGERQNKKNIKRKLRLWQGKDSVVLRKGVVYWQILQALHESYNSVFWRKDECEWDHIQVT